MGKLKNRYAIHVEGRGYLWVAKNSNYGRRRKIVHDLDDATLWGEVGHAKAAALQAVELKFLPARTRFAIVSVCLVSQGLVCAVERRLVGKFRTSKMVVVE